MTSDTQQDQTVTAADVEARAREALECSAYKWCEPGWSSEFCETVTVNRVNDGIAALAAANLRIVSASADDRRTEALARLREFAVACALAGLGDDLAEAGRALAPYLHDDDTGGKG